MVLPPCDWMGSIACVNRTTFVPNSVLMSPGETDETWSFPWRPALFACRARVCGEGRRE